MHREALMTETYVSAWGFSRPTERCSELSALGLEQFALPDPWSEQN